jgi:hypothetical protein
MKKYFILSLCIFVINVFPESFTTHGAIILLDSQETLEEDILGRPISDQPPFGALSETLLSALDQHTTPIIVSSSLLRNVIIRQEVFKDFAVFPLDDQQLTTKYGSLTAFNTQRKRNQLKEYLQVVSKVLVDTNKELSAATSINDAIAILNKKYSNQPHPAIDPHNRERYWEKLDPYLKSYLVIGNFDNWTCKKISDFLYVLIPNELLKNIHSQSDEDLIVGLKISHMPTIATNDVLSYVTYNIDYDSKELGNHFIQTLYRNDIFVSNNEYYQINKSRAKQYEIPRWAFYMEGHGSLKKTIAGILISEMAQFLEYLDTKISTGFLLFVSCYAGGKNLNLLYQYQNDSLNNPFFQKIYSYPIIVSSLTDAFSIGLYLAIDLPPRLTKDFIDAKDKKITFMTFSNFSEFFAELKKEGPIDFSKIVQFVRIIGLTGKEIEFFNNLPQIKLPGIEWVQVIDMPNKVVQIGKNLAQARDETLDVSTFFARNTNKQKIYPEALLLYTPIIPFPLKLSRGKSADDFKNPPAFISMLAGNAVHEFNEIDAPEFGLTKIIDAFFKIVDLVVSKSYFIKKLIVDNDVENWPNILIANIPKNTPMVLTDILITINFNSSNFLLIGNNIFFKYEGKSYKCKGVERNKLLKLTQIKEDYINDWKDEVEDLISFQGEDFVDLSSLKQITSTYKYKLINRDLIQFSRDLELLQILSL